MADGIRLRVLHCKTQCWSGHVRCDNVERTLPISAKMFPISSTDSAVSGCSWPMEFSAKSLMYCGRPASIRSLPGLSRGRGLGCCGSGAGGAVVAAPVVVRRTAVPQAKTSKTWFVELMLTRCLREAVVWLWRRQPWLVLSAGPPASHRGGMGDGRALRSGPGGWRRPAPERRRRGGQAHLPLG